MASNLNAKRAKAVKRKISDSPKQYEALSQLKKGKTGANRGPAANQMPYA